MKIYESRYGYSKFDAKEYKTLIGNILKLANDRSIDLDGLDNIEVSSKGYEETNNTRYYAEVTDNVIYVSFTHDVGTIFASIDTCKTMPVKIGLRLKRGDNLS